MVSVNHITGKKRTEHVFEIQRTEKDLDGYDNVDNVDPHFIAFSTSSWLVRY